MNKIRFMLKAIQVNYEKIFSYVTKTKRPEKKTSISGQKTCIYSRFLHTAKTSLLRPAPSLHDFVPNVRPQTEIKLHFRASLPSWKVSLRKIPICLIWALPKIAIWSSITLTVMAFDHSRFGLENKFLENKIRLKFLHSKSLLYKILTTNVVV